jgi:hypothetical protein
MMKAAPVEEEVEDWGLDGIAAMVPGAVRMRRTSAERRRDSFCVCIFDSFGRANAKKDFS